MEKPEDIGAPTEIAARKSNGSDEDPNESERAWQAFLTAVEARRMNEYADDFIGEEAA